MHDEGMICENRWQTSEHPLLHEGGFQIYYEKGGSLVKPSTLDEGYNSDDPEEGNFSDNGDGYYHQQSFIHCSAHQMEGVLRFVPGSILDPTGDVFDVRIAPFLFDDDPDFM